MELLHYLRPLMMELLHYLRPYVDYFLRMTVIWVVGL